MTVTGITNGPFVAVSDALLAVVIRWVSPVVEEDTASGGWQRRQESASLCPFLYDEAGRSEKLRFAGDE